MTRRQAAELVKFLLAKYEDKLRDAPPGETFEALYDQQTLTPLPRYQALYDEVKAELRERGVNFKDINAR